MGELHDDGGAAPVSLAWQVCGCAFRNSLQYSENIREIEGLGQPELIHNVAPGLHT